MAAGRHQGFWRKWNLTSPEFTGGPYLPSHQTWWTYVNGRPSYGNLCVFKMAVGRHLGFFAEVKCGDISVSGTSVLVSRLNFVRICAIATELWPFKLIFKMAAAAILDFSEVKCDVIGSHGKSPSHQILWSYVNGRPNYDDLCLFKMAVGRHLGFLRK